MSKDLLARLDERASALGLNRSQYLSQLARQDLLARGELTLREAPADYNSNSGKEMAEAAEDASLKSHEKRPSRKRKRGETPPT